MHGEGGETGFVREVGRRCAPNAPTPLRGGGDDDEYMRNAKPKNHARELLLSFLDCVRDTRVISHGDQQVALMRWKRCDSVSRN